MGQTFLEVTTLIANLSVCSLYSGKPDPEAFNPGVESGRRKSRGNAIFRVPIPPSTSLDGPFSSTIKVILNFVFNYITHLTLSCKNLKNFC
jgi:hypothetical protein